MSRLGNLIISFAAFACLVILVWLARGTLSLNVCPALPRCPNNFHNFNGSCYHLQTTPATFSWARHVCSLAHAHLVNIGSKEENDFVASLAPATDLWIGYTDQVHEGTFVWTQHQTSTYTNWHRGQPDNHDNQNCALIWGYFKILTWDDRSCHDKKKYVCEKDFDECASPFNLCHHHADCTNTVGSYTCQCKAGYSGNGRTLCENIDECWTGANNCHRYANTQCVDTDGSYQCPCKVGYSRRPGGVCTNVNECLSKSANHCHGNNSRCVDTDGSYHCSCS